MFALLVPRPFPLLALSLLFFAGCSKSSDPTPANPSEREGLLTTPNWHLTSVIQTQTAASGAVVTNDITPANATLPCAKDDFTHFNTDRSFIVNQGTIKCSPSGAQQTTPGTWGFAANETEIVFDPNQAAALHYRIQALTTATFSFVETSTSLDGTRFVRTTTYTPI